ncbi:MAG: hypothetical protein J6X28_05580 [Bacilli bacterium]|nr:hypothetical protein [Bacilli bacterium]
MANVDWITWKTDPNEIINPDQIEEEINEYFNHYDSYMSSMIYEPLKEEMNQGGLSKDAFQISGISPAYEMAASILKEIEEIKTTMESLQKEIKESSQEQKEIEKQQLIDAIEDKLSKEKLFLKTIESRQGIQDQIKKLGEDPQDIIGIINDRIYKLTERLEVAKSL